MQIMILGGKLFYEGKIHGRLLPEEEFAVLKPENIPKWAQNPYLHVFSAELTEGMFGIFFGVDGNYWHFNKIPYPNREDVMEQFHGIQEHLFQGTFHVVDTFSRDLSLVLD